MKELDPKTPKWFQKWVSNHFWHLEIKVNIGLWLLGIILGTMIAKMVIDFYW